MKFEPNVPFETADPKVVVDAGLRPGSYRFRLVVVNDRGLASAPVEVTVSVLTTLFTPTTPTIIGRPIITTPTRIIRPPS
jgi:hypothetical protein